MNECVKSCVKSCVLCVCVFRDQPGDSREPSGHCQHPAVPADAQVLEGKAPRLEETGKCPLHEGVCHDNIYIGLTLYTLIPCTGSKMGVLVTDKRLNWSAMAVQ